MSDEYICKDVALDALKAQADTMQSWVKRYAEQRRGILTAVNIIEDVEPDDVVEVVRCKDCVYCNKATYDCHNDRWGNGHAYYPPPVVREDGFCMDGKRREE